MPNPPGIAPKIRVLILDGFSNHNWKLNTKLLRGLLQPTGLFDVSVSTAPPSTTAPDFNAWHPDFSHTDVIIQTCNDISQKPAPAWNDSNQNRLHQLRQKRRRRPHLPLRKQRLPQLARIQRHHRPRLATPLLRHRTPNVRRRHHHQTPPRTRQSHQPRPPPDVLVHNLQNHPINQDLPKLWLSPKLEVYYDARGPAQNVTVLSYGQDPRFKDYWPLEWTVTYGQGRVYASSFGHVWSDESQTHQPIDLLATDEQILIQRALQWLARRPITVQVPANFPTAEKVSLSQNIPLPKD